MERVRTMQEAQDNLKDQIRSLREELNAKDQQVDRLRDQLQRVRSSPPNSSNSDEKLRRKYELQIAELRHIHSKELSDLNRQMDSMRDRNSEFWQQQYQSRLEEVKRGLKEQCKREYVKAVTKARGILEEKIRQKYESALRAMRDEQSLERERNQKDFRARLDIELREMKRKYHQRLNLEKMKIESDARRRVLEELEKDRKYF